MIKNYIFQLYFWFKNTFVVVLLFLAIQSFGQNFTKTDSLHGKLTHLRLCYDVNSYDITLKVEPDKKFISGKNTIGFTAKKDFQKLQLDLFEIIKIDSITFKNTQLSFTRELNAVYVNFYKIIQKNEKAVITVWFSGNPLEAKTPPWDGGFVWKKDSNGKDFVGLACEGIGASSWLPCKDYLGDEAESMKMHLIVPEGLIGVSNGRLISDKKLGDGFHQFNWQVKNTINNYNITINIADYFHIHDQYINVQNQKLDLDYYVLKGNENKAKTHFEQVKDMLACYEKHFGNYPFYQDSYKLVESDYWGMEHQSCVAYGNHFKNNEYGFDFIIIHESAHEWFGNSISCFDAAEMWIHESFTTYAETIYLECIKGKETAQKYLNMQRESIQNKVSMIGPYDVFFHARKDNDIYYKGAWVLHTMRNILNMDTLWFGTLYDFSVTHQKSIVKTPELIEYFSERSTYDWETFFEQYLYHSKIPVFEYSIERSGDKAKMTYQLKADVSELILPVKIQTSENETEYIIATEQEQVLFFKAADIPKFKIFEELFLVDFKKMVKK